MEVYLHINRTNGKMYAGWTVGTALQRFRSHCRNRASESHFLFQRALKKYGPENFDTMAVFVNTVDEAKHLERHLIAKNDLMNPDKGYNMTAGGDGNTGHGPMPSTQGNNHWTRRTGKNPFRGCIHKAETKQLIAEKKRDKRCSVATEFKKGQHRSTATEIKQGWLEIQLKRDSDFLIKRGAAIRAAIARKKATQTV